MEITPKDKAKEIINNHYGIKSNCNTFIIDWIIAKQCAIETVNEIEKHLEPLCLSYLVTYTNPKIYFFKKVREEIEKL